MTFILFVLLILPRFSENVHPDVGLTTEQLVKRRGYPIQTYRNVETQDGYLLTLHRMPYGKEKNNRQKKRPVVFLMHGLLCTSTIWVNMGPSKSLAYALVNAGYDVWMGNARGNMFSRKHSTYDPDEDPQFWKFSWHQIGKNDLPTMIDFILNKTGESQLYYIGHSQGTTTFFVMTSELPKYNRKIKLMIALAPVAFMSNMNNKLIELLSQNYATIYWLSGLFGIGEFLPSELMRDFILSLGICNEDSVIQEVCTNLIFTFVGWDEEELDPVMVPVITSSIPGGSSAMQLAHYAQEVLSGKFCRYDFGPNANKRIYGSTTPPEYNLSRITVPVALINSENDALVGEKDVNKLARRLPKVVDRFTVKYKKFSHFDFLFARDVRRFVYNHILELLKKF